MNVSLLQPHLGVATRASNLSILKHMIRAEAERSPAPDLIVLPACCVAAQGTGVRSDVTLAMCQGFAEAFAWWAREWGIWIAVGHSTRIDAGLREVVTLFDPDGDPFIRAFGRTDEAPDGADFWVVRATPIGRIALCASNLCASNLRTSNSIEAYPCPSTVAKPALDLIIVPAKKPSRSATAKLAVAYSSFVVSTGCVLDEDDADVQSFIADRDGNNMAKTVPAKASTARASIIINPITASDENHWEVIDSVE